jgi:diguanylate cyclase (GGDEF)-like protein/PAS domain S-box-containing protein
MNERIQKIINNSQVVIFYWQAKEGWPVEFVSKNIERFGYNYSDFTSGRVQYVDIIHPDDVERVMDEVVNYTQRGLVDFRQVYRILDGQGAVRWIDARTTIERNDKGVAEYYLGTIIDITEQKEAEHYSTLLGTIVSQSSTEIYVFDRISLKFTYLNLTALESCGITMQTARTLTPLDVKPEMSLAEFKQLIAPLNRQNSPLNRVTFETIQKRADGSSYPADISVKLLDIDGQLQYVSVVRDISEIKALQHKSEQQHAYVQNVLDGLSNEVMVIRPDYSLEWMNQATRVRMQSEWIADPENPKCYEVSHYCSRPCDGLDHPCPLKEVLKTKQEVTVIHNHGYDGVDLYMNLVAKPMFDEQGEVSSIVESAHNITPLIQLQDTLRDQADKMSHQATHDGLTGLPNRRLFYDRLDESINRNQRLSAVMAVVFIDIDKFKDINDTLGHQAGDEVLIAVSSRFRTCLRASDTIARLGGDEFTLIIEGVADKKGLAIVLQKIMLAFDETVNTSAGSVDVSLSAGVSIYPQDATDRKTLVRDADRALYDVKVNGRKGFKFFDEMPDNG